MPDTKDSKTGEMLLSMIASVAIAGGVSPEKAARAFTVDKKEKSTQWLADFTMECMKQAMSEMTKPKKK